MNFERNKTFVLILAAIVLYFCIVSFKFKTNILVKNPVIPNFEYHDASLIRKGDWFYSFVSCVAPRNRVFNVDYYTVSIFRSRDLVNWNFFKYALNNDNIIKEISTFEDQKYGFTGRFPYRNEKQQVYYAIWAPDVIFYKKFFYLFVALHFSKKDSKIAVFKSKSIDMDFSYSGILASSDSSDNKAFINMGEIIDPFPIVDKGKLYLMFGSFKRDLRGGVIRGREDLGVYMAEILFEDEDIALGKKHFITDYYEGCIIVPHNDKFYLFGTNGNLWDFRYQIHYASSETITGPYLNKEGKSIADTINYNPGTPILVTKENDRFNGFGCPSYPIIDKNGQYWMMMHGHAPELPPILMDKPEKERYTFLIPLYWDNNGNPYFDVDEIQKDQIKKPAL